MHSGSRLAHQGFLGFDELAVGKTAAAVRGSNDMPHTRGA